MKSVLKLVMAGAFILLCFKSEWNSSVFYTNVYGIKQNDFEDIYRLLATEADECRKNIELGKLGSERSDKKRIKEFGQQMVRDYSRLLQKIEMMAVKKEMKLPEVLSYDKFKTLNKLRKRQGNSFDRMFVRAASSSFSDNIAMLKNIYPFDDHELQSLINENIEITQAHLEALKKVRKRN